MADCIDRKDAIDAIWKVRITPGGELFNAIKRAQEELIKQLPSAGPERKKGKWNRTELYPHRIYCSVCYKTYIKNDELLERWEFPMNYCPNCGAEMVGE